MSEEEYRACSVSSVRQDREVLRLVASSHTRYSITGGSVETVSHLITLPLLEVEVGLSDLGLMVSI